MLWLAGCSSLKHSSAVQLQHVTIGKDLTFDLYDQGVSAGNLQPPFGESSEKIDLNELLITNEIATFFCRVSGRSMEPHMRDGDVLMVDKSIEPKVARWSSPRSTVK